jgi:predicted RecB family nuclease
MELSPLAAQFARRFTSHRDTRSVAIAGISAQSKDAVIAKSPLKAVNGLGDSAIFKLMELGIDTVEKLVSADEQTLKKAINPVTLKQVKTYIKQNAGKQEPKDS